MLLQNERECECLPGYVGNGVQCLEKVVPPVDRCLQDNGGCDPMATCKDLHYHGKAPATASVTMVTHSEGLTYSEEYICGDFCVATVTVSVSLH